MNYREVQIEDDLSVPDSGTLTVDLDLQDPITALIIRFKVKNDGAMVMNLPPERHITKVEIVDGGQVYWALKGQMAVGAAVYGLGRWPHHWYDEAPGSNQRINFPILFGRYLGDEQFAFNPRNLTNPQLKITWTDQVLYDDNFHTIGITARVMEGVSAPAQCLMWKEIESWATADSGVHKVDLPTDYPIRALLMRAYANTDLPSSIWTRFKLDCDLGKLIPFDLASHEFRDIIKQYAGPFSHRQFIYGTQATARQCWLGETLNVLGTAASADSYIFSYTAFWSFVNISVMKHDGTQKDTLRAQMSMTGLFPHSCYLYPFGRESEPATWFDAKQYKSVALKITEGVADAAAAVAVQQPRSLP